MKASTWTVWNLASYIAMFVGLPALVFFGALFRVTQTPLDLLLALLGGASFLFGLCVQFWLATVKRVRTDFVAKTGRQQAQGPPSALSRSGEFVIAMLAGIAPRFESEEFTPTTASRIAVAATQVIIFAGLCLAFGVATANALTQAFCLVFVAVLATAMLYFAVIGLFLPRRAFEDDRALRSLIGRAGIRSLLGLRLAGAFLLVGLIFLVLTFVRLR